jgi:hypothetical protein
MPAMVKRLIPLLLLPACALAQFTQVGGPLGTSGLANVAISADGNTAIVGLPGDSRGVGAAEIFVRTNGVWSQQGGKLVGNDAAGNAAQGISVALSGDGNTALVGGWNDNNRIGAAWVFVRTNGSWAQQGPKLVGGSIQGTVASQGSAVALSYDGNTALVGGYNDLNQSITTGATWVFVRTGVSWAQQGPKLIGNDWTHGLNVSVNEGSSVALSSDGNTAAIGAQTDSTGLGSTWVFVRNNGQWTQQSVKLVGAGATGAAQQGSSLALSADGNTLAVGGPFDSNNTGAVWIFIRVLGGWIPQGGKLVGFGASGAAQQGSSLAISGDGNTVVVGGQADSNNSGALWVFKRSNGTWSQQGNKLTAVASAPQLGYSLGLSTDATTIFASGNVGPFVFGQAPPVHIGITAPANVSAGTAFQFRATALDPNNNTLPGYSGTLHFSSSDPAASLPVDAPLANGTASFSATLNTLGSQAITATDTASAAITGTSAAIAVGAGTSPGAVQPPSGGGSVQTFTFTFGDPRGYQDLDVVNVLINNFLDGRQACYLAYSRPLNVIYLVNDAGAALLQGLSNSQCSVSNLVAFGSGNTLTVAVNVSFTASFAGNKIVYMAARDLQGGNSGWQALGAWGVPGAVTNPSVVGVNPSHGVGSAANFTFSFGDTNGYQDLGVVDILINNFLDGRQACYIAFSRPLNTLYLVNDAGGGLLAGLSNSQCTVTLTNSSMAGNALTLNLNITFTSSFKGNHVIYMAARDSTDANNSGWQAAGSWTVQ